MAVLLASAISAANWPLNGFDYYNDTHEGTKYSLTRVSGGSPSGSDSARFVGVVTNIDGGQFDWGWSFLGSLPAVTQGATRYVRYRLKINSPVVWLSSNNGKSCGGKVFIIGNNVENAPYSPTRVINNLGSAGPSRTVPEWEFDQNIAGVGGGGDGIKVLGLADGWHNVQLMMQSSSTTDSTDARLSIWDNNNDEGTPNGTATGFVLKTAGWSQSTSDGNANLLWGTGAFNELATGSTFDVEFADFEYADSFDDTWHIGDGGGGEDSVVGSGLAPYAFLF